MLAIQRGGCSEEGRVCTVTTYRTSKTEGQWLEVTLGREAGTSLVAQMVKNPPTVQETRVGSLGLEDPWGRKW